jgi:hypothetical protein
MLFKGKIKLCNIEVRIFKNLARLDNIQFAENPYLCGIIHQKYFES